MCIFNTIFFIIYDPKTSVERIGVVITAVNLSTTIIAQIDNNFSTVLPWLKINVLKKIGKKIKSYL